MGLEAVLDEATAPELCDCPLRAFIRSQQVLFSESGFALCGLGGPVV